MHYQHPAATSDAGAGLEPSLRLEPQHRNDSAPPAIQSSRGTMNVE
jgi:hypothetical protein